MATTEIAAGGLLGEGRYRLERRLGAGGMASVWLAHDVRLQRPVAVKVLSDVLAGDASYVRRFRREARVAAGLAHANLVTVYDFGDHPRPFLVMELIEGGTVAERLEHGAAGLDCGALARDVLTALAHVHVAGIVHRDVKPGNVLIDRDGRFRLTDFGIARPEDATRLTQTGDVIGTLRYLAPEVVSGAPATARSDLYAVGVLLRECVGRRPQRLTALVDELADPDPARRPATAGDALVMLDGGAQPTASETPRPESAPSLQRAETERPGDAATTKRLGWRRGRRLRLAPALALFALAAVIALVVVASVGGGDGGDSRSRTVAPAPADAQLERQLDALERAVRAAEAR